jgi:23S rRNA pseudouridine2604 synthase
MPPDSLRESGGIFIALDSASLIIYSKYMSRTPPPLPIDGYPMRLNKYLAHQGLATRRAADDLITKKKVLINGRIAVLGDKVNETDKVALVGTIPSQHLVYFAYNKPVGVITHSPQVGEKDIKQSITGKRGSSSDTALSDVFPIGRLDKDSSGLIILTNDGRVTDRLLNPEYTHDKEYRVRTLDTLRESFKKSMEAGVNIEGYLTQPCAVRKTGPKSFNITLTEGKKHQIRRMVSAMHNTVTDLERTRILNIRLEDLKPNATRPIQGDELTTFLTSLGIK